LPFLETLSLFNERVFCFLYNLQVGVYTVYVRDIEQCKPKAKKEVYILGYPKFFTPNGDGINDFWKIQGLKDIEYISLRIRIFNRFGKLITELNEYNNFSWDGNYEGIKQLSDDYWFEVLFQNGEVKKGHFTLKR